MRYLFYLFFITISFSSHANTASIPSEQGRVLKVIFSCFYQNPTQTIQHILDAPYEGEYPLHLCTERTDLNLNTSRWGKTFYVDDYHCPNPEYPILSEDKTMCYQSEPVKPSCDDPALQKDVQIEQYKCHLSNPETEFFKQVFQWWCEDGDLYTHCSYEPKDCIQGLTCTKPSDDIPVCDPREQECALPEPDPETPGQPDDPIIPPTEPPVDPDLPPIDLCEQFPELCSDPQPPTDPQPPVPDPDVPSDPDAPTDDKLLNEAKESNNHLTNIGEYIKKNTKELGDLLVQNNIIGQHQLGKLNDLLNKTFGGGAGGIGSTISQGNEIAKEGNKKLDELGDTLDDIKCELDDDCADKEKPTAKVDCEQSIFECKGDIIQCALLKVEYEGSCPIEELAQLEKEINASFGVDNVSSIVQTEEIDFGNIDPVYLNNGVSFGGSGCPSPHSVPNPTPFGNPTIEISFEPACTAAETYAPVHMILAWIAGLFIIGRTQGAF